MLTKKCLQDLEHEALGRKAPQVMSGPNPTVTDWTAFNNYKSKFIL